MTLTFGQGVQILQGLSGLNIAQQVADFKGSDQTAQAEDVLMDLEMFATLAGYVFPAAATAAQWIHLAEVALPILVQIDHHMPPKHVLLPGEYEAFGHVFNGTISQGTFAR